MVLETNSWGNDQGDTAGGLELVVTAPTASHGLGSGKIEGGATFLLALELPGNFDLGINNGVGSDANDGSGYDADSVNSVSVSHPIAGPLSGYVELFSSVPTRSSGDWEGTVDVGALLTIGKKFQLDAGLDMGVAHGADGLQSFLGASYRF